MLMFLAIIGAVVLFAGFFVLILGAMCYYHIVNWSEGTIRKQQRPNA